MKYIKLFEMFVDDTGNLVDEPSEVGGMLPEMPMSDTGFRKYDVVVVTGYNRSNYSGIGVVAEDKGDVLRIVQVSTAVDALNYDSQWKFRNGVDVPRESIELYHGNDPKVENYRNVLKWYVESDSE